jgi:hypothetical protein
MVHQPPDYRLWGVVTGVLLVPVGIVYLLTTNVARLTPTGFAADATGITIGCAFVGWIVHGVLVAFGVRVHMRQNRSQVADYDDRLAEPKLQLRERAAPEDGPPDKS